MVVDLRSDTLTKPTPEMIAAMTKATMGDDVFSEDPTILKLQEKAAKMLGKEAGLFVVSGTMANQLAIASQTQPHDEVIVDMTSHIFQFEQGAPAVISGVQLRPMPYQDDLPKESWLEKAYRFPDIHHPVSRLLCLEITHNYNGGTVCDYDKFKSVCKKAKDLGLKVHIDGARIWNACIATGRPVTDFASLSDTVMFCFSKGLGAPIGSVLVGPAETIKRAHYLRKGLGGGWRQAGMLAAAANYALDNHIERLADDHRRTQTLAAAIESNANLELAGPAETNMVFFRPKSGKVAELSENLKKAGILQDWSHFGDKIRLVTYLNIDDEMIKKTTDTLAKQK
jgi:threonine aldolase